MLGLKHRERLRHLTHDLPQVNMLRESVCIILIHFVLLHFNVCVSGGQEPAEDSCQRATGAAKKRALLCHAV